MLQLASIDQLIPIALFSLGVSYVVTGSQIGFCLRLIWWMLWHKVPLLRQLTTLAFCPGCSAWWIGLVSAVLVDLPWEIMLQCAFVSSGFAAVLQGIAGIAAADEDVIEKTVRGIFEGESHGE